MSKNHENKAHLSVQRHSVEISLNVLHSWHVSRLKYKTAC